MLNRIFLLTIILLFISSLNFCYSQETKKINSPLHGKDLIKFQKIKTKTMFKNDVKKYYEEYDTSGEMTYDIEYNDSGKFERSHTYFISEKNLFYERYLRKDNEKEEMIIYNYRYDTSGTTYTKYQYDSAMKLTMRFVETKDSMNGIYKFEMYDVSEVGEHLFMSTEYRYEKDKDKIKKAESIHHQTLFCNNIDFRIVYKYDDDGNNIEQDRYEGKNEYFYSIKLNYYSLGKLTESHEYFYSKFSPKEYYFKFDDNGNLIELTAFKDDGSINYSTSYKYDINNNLAEEIHTGKEKNMNYIEMYKYEYYK